MKDDMNQGNYRKMYQFMTSGKKKEEEPEFLKLVKLAHNRHAIKITTKNFKLMRKHWPCKC